MSQRLQFVHDWQVLAKESGYKPRELAALCQISLRTLERHFQKHYGLTVAQWLKELRLQEAYEQLKQGNIVKEVAFNTGYKQLSHFSREFKNEFGISPSMLLFAMGSKGRSGARQESPTSPQMVFTF